MDSAKYNSGIARTNCAESAAYPSLSRRRFLQVAASMAGSSLIAEAQESSPPQRLGVPPGTPKSRVVKYQSRKLVRGRTVHQQMLTDAFAVTLTNTVPNAQNPVQAWQSLLQPSDVVGIKFNRSAQDALGTTPTMAATIIESLISAGFAADRLVCIEAPEETRIAFGTARPRPGYTEAVHDFGSGADQLSAVLDQVTAIINVPFLKTHNIAGITCALKNLSHGLVKHPARYHSNGCAPYIADIVALDPIRSKLRLCVVDALRMVFDKGPSATAETIADEGIILASTDPVAIDSIGLALIDNVRAERRLPRIAETSANLEYLANAHKKGLGIAVPHGIDVVTLAE